MSAQFGVFLIPDAEHPEQTIELALTAERLGLDLIGVQDHPYQHRFFDAFSLLAFIAGRTERITLVPDVANLPLRPPAQLAKSAASIDLLSGGRFELGLGAGAFWDAISAMGGPRRTPREAVDAVREAIEVLRLAWSGEPTISYDGRHYRVDGFKPGPQPVHRIGIWLGAYGPRMIRLTGSSADGWLPSIPRLPLDQVLPRQRAIDEAANNAGRDPQKIRRVANVNGEITSRERGGFLRGPAAQWVEDLRWMRDEYRFDTFIFWGDGDPDDQLRRFGEEVAPALRDD